MRSQSNQSPELNRADTSEAPMTGEDRFAKVPAQLDELLERGEISLEAFPVYSALADAALSLTRLGAHCEPRGVPRVAAKDQADLATLGDEYSRSGRSP